LITIWLKPYNKEWKVYDTYMTKNFGLSEKIIKKLDLRRML